MLIRVSLGIVEQSGRQSMIVILTIGLHVSVGDINPKVDRAGERLVLPTWFTIIELARTRVEGDTINRDTELAPHGRDLLGDGWLGGNSILARLDRNAIRISTIGELPHGMIGNAVGS